MRDRFQTDTNKLVEHVRRGNFLVIFVCALVFLTARAIPPLPDPPLEELTKIKQLFNVRGAFLDVKRTLLDTKLTEARMLLLGDPPEKYFLHYFPLFATDLESDIETIRDLRNRWDSLLNLPVHDIAGFAPYALEGETWKATRVVLPSVGYKVSPKGMPTSASRVFEGFTNAIRARTLAESVPVPAHLAEPAYDAAMRVGRGGVSIILFFAVDEDSLERIPVLRETLEASTDVSFRAPLTEFDDYFPMIQANFSEVADLPLEGAFERLATIAEEAREKTRVELDSAPPVRLFGLEIPRTDVLAYGSLLVIFIQLYFYLHVSTLARSIAAAPPEPLAPWIGLYDTGLARGTYLLSIAVPPLAALVMTLVGALPLRFIGETSWLVYSFATLIVSLVLIVATVTATARIWKVAG
jgi:hypothetical protein